MKFKDYYSVLEIDKNASQDDIKRSYRKLARKFHPDVNKDPGGEERFKEIGEAYEVLKDPEKRAAYDRLGSGIDAGQEFTPPPNWDAGFEFSAGQEHGGRHFSDFFEELFGRMAGGGEERDNRYSYEARGEDHFAKILIDLDDSYHGATKTITLQMSSIDRAGRVATNPHTLNVKIPKGIMEGQRIRLAGKGGPGMGDGPRGDLYLEVAFNQHRLFKILSRDLYLDLPVSPWEAALGATVTAPTLGGKVDLKVPPNSQTGGKLRLKGKGLPGKPPGDLYVILQIVTPKADSADAVELYKQMASKLSFNPRSGII